ncbi:hypothetical protein RALTA_A0837 [Cupriavidus taiwanensis LMG 19424]|uniref:Uncharacterized protein n=1 Tax=Cupriavidus taiwanensis (strain DSM 17343 / BCRC 17206 / CCUG 44338 / CIP 107171 / LMG 19424 / R1) TaxID=977880 RepID=B3R3C6_CUPTR|nr:hypothetical protein RALTA_A0837 [Cupriavidus taiwanensis LMG 19424]
MDKQIAAYAELQQLRNELGENVFAIPIFQSSTAAWPYDFEMELHTVKNQLDAGIRFFQYESNEIPADILEQIKTRCMSEWPDDHEMKLYTLEKQIEAWKQLNSI